MKRILTAILLVLSMQAAWAIDLNDAKAQGLIGEARTGYLAAVEKPVSAEVKALIAEVNPDLTLPAKAVTGANNSSPCSTETSSPAAPRSGLPKTYGMGERKGDPNAHVQ